MINQLIKIRGQARAAFVVLTMLFIYNSASAYGIRYVLNTSSTLDPLCTNIGSDGGSIPIILILEPTNFGEVFIGGETITYTHMGLFDDPQLTDPLTNANTWAFCNPPIGQASCINGLVPRGAWYKYAYINANEVFTVTASWAGGTASTTGKGNFAFAETQFCLNDTYSVPNEGYQYSTEPYIITLPSGMSQTDQEFIISTLAGREEPYTLYKHFARSIGDPNCRTVLSTRTFNVYSIPDTEMRSDTLACVRSGSTYDLNLLRVNEGVSGGTFRIVGQNNMPIVPIKVDNGELTLPSEPTCYDIEFSVTSPGAMQCGVTPDTSKLFVLPGPDTEISLFDQNNDPLMECQCTTGGNITGTFTDTGDGEGMGYTVTSTSSLFVGTIDPVTNTYSLPAPLYSDAPDAVNDVVYTICAVDTNQVAFPCEDVLDVPRTECLGQSCVKVLLYSTESGCDENRLLTNTCKPVAKDVCPVEPNPQFKLKCSIFPKIPLFDVLTVDANFDQNLLFCGKDEVATGSFQNTLIGISGADINSGITFGALPGVSSVCELFQQEIFGVQPFKGLYDLIGCERSLANFIVEALALALGGTGSGYIVRADTDGDGAFDYTAEQGIGSASGDFTVPNNVKGSGYITVRAVYSWPRAPRDVCGELVRPGKELIDILPFGLIPVAGPIIKEALSSCKVLTNWSAEKTIQIPVLNESGPVFQNCYEDGLVFNTNDDCTSPVQWSVPIAHEDCSEVPLVYKGYTATADDSNFAGSVTPAPVTIEETGVYQVLGPIPGSEVDPGIYDVHYLAVGCNGKPDTCKFQVTVSSSTPTLVCPSNITASTEVDQCRRQLYGLDPVGGIGCNTLINYSYTNPVSGTVVSSSSTTVGSVETPNGNYFELGTTTVTYTLNVDLNNDGDYTDPGETQMCSFNVTIEDNQKPDAICSNLSVQLNSSGTATINASGSTNAINGGSTDNCDTDLTYMISENGTDYFSSINVGCEDIGFKYFTLRVTDDNGNVSECRAEVEVRNFFENYQIVFDAPEFCLEPFQNTFDLSNYVKIIEPNGNVLNHSQVSTLGTGIVGAFSISAFIAKTGEQLDPGSITSDGVYTQGTGKGYLTLTYMLSIDGQVQEATSGFTGCFKMAHDVVTIEDLSPNWTGGSICCDQSPVWLGGAGYTDGTQVPTVPAGMLSLTDIGGSYPADAYGEWTGAGVSFQDPDGVANSGDEFYQFNPSDLDGPIALTYIVGDEPCIYTHVQNINVTCQDLQRALDDIEVCPASLVEPRVVDVNFDDPNIVISTTGLAAAGGQDLDQVPVVDGKVTIPGFTSVAVRNDTFAVTVFADQTTNDFACSDMFVYNIVVLDTLAPVFTNCPRPSIVVDAPEGWCSAYVNFSLPLAEDNCSEVDIVQTDTTGLLSGDLFPVGLTILEYTATDSVGNSSTCDLKIFVNDFHTPPTIECPSDTIVGNDAGMCGAVVNNIGVVSTQDNCPDNMVVLYELKDAAGTAIGSGIDDASGEKFPGGTTTVEYTVYDQPLILITEVVQDGMSGVEISNLGGSTVGIQCATLERRTAIDTVSHVVTYGTELSVGGVYKHMFSLLPAGTEATYVLSIDGYEIDAVTINDGTLDGENIIRIDAVDNNDASDWRVANGCEPGSFGVYNPELPVGADNGKKTSLQKAAPSSASCSFTVTVEDLEAPMCMQTDTITLIGGTLDLTTGGCMTSTVTATAGEVADINILNFVSSIDDVSQATINLVSPSGTKVKLLGGTCSGVSGINVILDDLAPTNIDNASCTGPLGSGATFAASGELSEFVGEDTAGDWTLEVYGATALTGSIDSWTLEILTKEAYNQTDIVQGNDAGECKAAVTWEHPYYMDNCPGGRMTVTYSFSNSVTGVSNVDTEDVLNGNIDLDGTVVTRELEVGTTIVKYELTDVAGNTGYCEFAVAVNDTEIPTFPDGCSDHVFQLKPGECTASLSNLPRVEDNCDIKSDLEFFDENGSSVDVQYLPIGEYKVIAKATDIYGNMSTCEFNVTVIEHEMIGESLVCNNEINLSLGVDCTASISPDALLEGNNYGCYDNFCVSIEDGKGAEHPNQFDQSDIGQTFKVTIKDCDGLNSCWGYVNIEEKLSPIIECPKDTTIHCTIDPLGRDADGKLNLGELAVKTCEPNSTIAFVDEKVSSGTCSTVVINRKWTIRDASGMEATCTQKITVLPFDNNGVDFPRDWRLDDALNCAAVSTNPDLLKPEHRGVPQLDGRDIYGPGNQYANQYCQINVGYWDERLDDINCGSSYEILRNWIVRNECEPLVPGVNPIRYIQSIKVEDDNAPTLPTFVDTTLLASTWGCTAEFKLPDLTNSDDCSSVQVDWSTSYGKIRDGYVTNLRKGVTDVTAKVKDACGNISYTSFKISLIDRTAPVVVTKQNIVVSLSPQGPDNEYDGQSKMTIEHIDNGSYDECTDVYLEIRRKNDAPACENLGVNGYNNNATFNNDGHLEDSSKDTDGGQVVKFCCEDLTRIEGDANEDGVVDDKDAGYVQVMLRAWDDGDMDGVYGTAGDNYNESWAWVKVENKLPPVLTCPEDASISCDWPIVTSTTWKDASEVTFDKTGEATAYGICAANNVQFKDRLKLNQCGIGLIERDWRVKSNPGVICRQNIIVTANPGEVRVQAPSKNDYDWTACSFGVEDVKDNQKPKTVAQGPCDVIGENIKIDTFLFENGVCKKWAVTYKYWNWCTDTQVPVTGKNVNADGTWTSYYFYDDKSAPMVECEDQMFEVDANCEHDLVLRKTATDVETCTTEGWLKWQFFMDAWADGTVDYYASSHRTEKKWKNINKYRPNGDLNAEWLALPAGNLHPYGDVVYVKGLESTTSGEELVVEVGAISGLMSNHKVKWKVTDGCHNHATCSENLMVVDKKAPTPYCVPLYTALMNTEPKMVELWANDFNNGAFDNCTPKERLLFSFGEGKPEIKDTIIQVGTKQYLVNKTIPHYFDENGFVDFNGDGVTYPKARNATKANFAKGITKGGTGVQEWRPADRSSGAVFSGPEWNDGDTEVVKIRVWDEKCNSDYCEVPVSFRLASNVEGVISGKIATEDEEPVRALVALDSDQSEFPKSVSADINGSYIFGGNPFNHEYSLSVEYDDDYRKGLNTRDLIAIQRHILGLTKFDSPYKVIASDVDGNERINGNDLFIIRKLILNLQTTIDNVPAWRFVDGAQKFDNVFKPWPVNYTKETGMMSSNMTEMDFVAVKIGDVLRKPATRTATNVVLSTEDRVVEAGEVVEVTFTSENYEDVYGYQFTMEVEGLRLNGVSSGAVEMTESNVAVLNDKIITMATSSATAVTAGKAEGIFTASFTATESGRLSEMMNLTSSVTEAMAVSTDLTEAGISIEFIGAATEAVSFALYQNEPNPFKAETVIGYTTAEAGLATITVLDVTGKVIYRASEDAKAGYNTFTLTDKEVPVSGVLYYQVESGDDTATMKMISVK